MPHYTDTFVSHLECSMTGEHYAADELHNLSQAGYPLWVRYDLPQLSQSVSKQDLLTRPPDLWRYREFLPVRHRGNIVSLGEVTTPLIALTRCQHELKVQGQVIVKDESRLPTGSFKARGLALAVSMAKELGVKTLAMPTNGNAGAAMSAYAARAGLSSVIFCPSDTPAINLAEIEYQGARLYNVNGLINDCGKLVGAGKQATGWFDVSTLKEPYRIEGKKTMGLELCEQFAWDLPDVIFYPTGGGTGLIGMWKAFQELTEIGWTSAKLPRMVAVQATGCAPIVRAYEAGQEHATLWENAHTIAAGIRVPAAIGDFLILRAVRDSGGFAIAVSDEQIEAARQQVSRADGLLMCPEGAATYAAYLKSLETGQVSSEETAVLFNCASGLKYPLPAGGRPLDRHAKIDYRSL